MFTPDQTGRPASPHPDLQRTVYGCCAVCKVHLNSFADPRLLPCLHIVCNTCLAKICTDGATQGENPLVLFTVWLGRSLKSNFERYGFKIASHRFNVVLTIIKLMSEVHWPGCVFHLGARWTAAIWRFSYLTLPNLLNKHCITLYCFN